MERNENGTFKNGTVPNPNGRPKGSLNNSTSELREFFTNFINGYTERINEDFEALEPKDRLKLVIDISKFVLPTLKAIDLKTELPQEDNRPVINFVLTSLISDADESD